MNDSRDNKADDIILPVGLEQEACDDVKKCIYKSDLKEGALIFSQGDAPLYYYYLIKGHVRVSKITVNGAEVQLAKLSAPYWFGEMSFLDGAPRTHNAIAASDIRLGKIAISDMQYLMQTHKDFYHMLVRQLCHHTRLLYAAADDFLLLSPEQRLAKQFLKLFNEQKGLSPKIPLTQDEIARMIGVSRQSVSRILRKWANKEIIQRKYGYIIIMNVDSLKSILAP
ncbi:hypothetical protein LPB140_07030 [Sphingorhabdus lutea]|uniref:Crp/Fnr family transcriptional regulator n=1 Tax=Sphingorhabdus lutea TaxID=1913578 RepID=A0A1L3JBR6_9SPHN|nr:Crp/Fnr family transcriptional regulator [Sphingorhabdus lutea]APG62576.1 hypothetical protein LPB140_07030 [Sphingorhabdus lutea]